MHWSRHIQSVQQMAGILQENPPEQWLSAAEQHRWAQFGSNAALLSWLSGRWCMKQLLRDKFGVDRAQLFRIHIQSHNGREQGVRPEIFLDGRLQASKVSLAHSPQLSAAFLLDDPTGSIGIDIYDAKDHSSQIGDFWFSKEEITWCEHGIAPGIIWSLKEALYKANNQGESFRPRTWDVTHWLSLSQCQELENKQGAIACKPKPGQIAGEWYQNSLLIIVTTKYLTRGKATATREVGYALSS